jgi:tetrahydromethanopterin S-methyltransferase subunit F
LLIDDSITVVNNKSITSDQIIPEITLNENITAPISTGQVLGTIKYKVDDIEYSANLIAKNDVVQKTDISIYLLIAGVVLFLFSLGILKRNKRASKKRRKR